MALACCCAELFLTMKHVRITACVHPCCSVSAYACQLTDLVSAFDYIKANKGLDLETAYPYEGSVNNHCHHISRAFY